MTLKRALPLLGLLAAMACTSSDDNNYVTPPLLNVLPRELSAPETALITAQNEFGFDLFRRAQPTSLAGNVTISPFSASVALGMTLNGADGTTLDAMRTALRMSNMSMTDVDAGYRSLLTLLAGLDRTTDFTVANSVWADTGYPFLTTFLDATRTNFDAEVRTLDLQASGTPAAINGWVSSTTHGAIPAIVSTIKSSEVMLLLNAIYFKGTWRKGFDASKTISRTFNATDGAQSVPTMSVSDTFAYLETSDAQLVEMPYGNGAYVMTLVLPSGGQTLAHLITTLDAAKFASWTSAMRTTPVMVLLPRFHVDYDRILNEDLAAMGMGPAFDPLHANFHKMATIPSGENLYVSGVEQKTFIDVNESGTVAAAVTSAGVSRTSSKETEFEANRPFLFVLRERLTGTIFFVGQVNKIQ